MKVLLSVLALAFSTSVFGDERGQPPLVTTSGTAVIKVVPDLAELYFTVTVRDANLDEARKRQAERFAKVLAALRAAGIAETDLKSEQVEISLSGDEYEYAVVKEGEKEVYRVSQDIACNVSDVSKVTDISASVFAAGATSTRGATLRTSQLRKYRDEARIKTIRFAREKATALAAIRVEFIPPAWPCPLGDRVGLADGGSQFSRQSSRLFSGKTNRLDPSFVTKLSKL